MKKFQVKQRKTNNRVKINIHMDLIRESTKILIAHLTLERQYFANKTT